MEEQKLNKSNNEQISLGTAVRFKQIQSNQVAPSKDVISYKINKKRSISSLHKNDRSYSPHNQIFKQKHLMYKKDLLTEKFQNLHLEARQKKEKKPLKLKIQKENKQNNFILARHLNDLSNSLENKFEAQNSLLKRSLDKLQRFMKSSTKNSFVQKETLVKQNKDQPLQKYKTISNQQKFKTQNQTLYKKQISKWQQQKCRFEEEIQKIKAVNKNLNSQNYKLSIQISMLKQKIIQLQQNDYDEAMKQSQKIIQSQNEQNEQNQNQQSAIKSFKQGEQIKKKNNKESKEFKYENNEEWEQHKNENQRKNQEFQPQSKQNKQKQNKKDAFSNQFGLNQNSDSKSSQLDKKNILIKQIKAESFSLKNNSIEQLGTSIQEHKQISSQKKEEKKEINEKTIQSLAIQMSTSQYSNLIAKIKYLESQLTYTKVANQQLSNQIARLKLKSSFIYKSKNQTFQDQSRNQFYSQPKSNKKMTSIISIQMENNEFETNNQSFQANNIQKEVESLAMCPQKADIIKQSKNCIENQLKALSCKGTKSKILSNQIIYFAEAISQQKHSSVQKLNQKKLFFGYQDSQKQNQNPKQGNSYYHEEHERKKTQCMKKLQLHSQQVEKRRHKSISLMNKNIQKKSSPMKNTLSFYSKQKIQQLERIKQTLSFKFEAFKYTYELFQNQMILWPNQKAQVHDLKAILQEYPFFLDQSSITLLLGYCNSQSEEEIRIDKFCSKIKQFIKEYDVMTEQQEDIIQKKIYKRWKYTKEQIMQNLRKNQSTAGQITKQNFLSVFQEYKFEQKQIHYLLCQNVAISSDVNHIKYKQYLQNFLMKQ